MIPHHTTIKFKIGQFLHRKPSSTMEDVCTALRGRKQRYLCECVAEMIRDGQIVEISGRLSCARAMQRHFDQLAEAAERQNVELQIVPPRDNSFNNKAWTGKYDIKDAPRREPIREVSFLNGSSGFAYGFRA